MAIRVKHNISHYKLHRYDVWGFLRLSARAHNWNLYRRIRRFFIKVKRFKRKGYYFYSRPFDYDFGAILPKRKRKRKHWLTTSLKLVLIYYLTLTQKAFRKMLKKAYRKDGYFESNYLISLEGRIISFLYRSSLVSNLFDALKLVKFSYIFIENSYITFPNCSVNPFEMVSFNILIKSFIYMDVLVRMRLKRYLFHPANFIYVSFNLMYCYMYKLPYISDLIFTCPVDIFRATTFSYKHSGDTF